MFTNLLRSHYKVLLCVAGVAAVSYCGYKLYHTYVESSEETAGEDDANGVQDTNSSKTGFGGLKKGFLK